MRLPPNAEKEFIIVMKAPNNRVKYNMASYLYIKSASNSRRQNSMSDKYEIEKHLKKRGNDLSDIDIELQKTMTTDSS